MAIDKVLLQKEAMRQELEPKVTTLHSPSSEVSISYTLGLGLEEQIKYGKIGLYWLTVDLRNEYYKQKYTAKQISNNEEYINGQN